MRITVVALGKIGLPLAVQFAGRGHNVTGVDIDEAVVTAVGRGVPPFPGESGLETRLRAAVDDGRLTATTDAAKGVKNADAVVVVVPLVVDAAGAPDFGPLDAATQAIGQALAPGTLVSYETTLPVGTTRQRFLPLLETGSGMTCGEDFFLVFSPERVLTGRVFADLRRYPKLVGGVDDMSTRRGVVFYESVLEFDERPDLADENGVWPMTSSEEAEFAKLAETTYRDVNIGLANQFALFAERMGLDVHRVIKASNSQPFSHIHSPGVAVGGHCIPVYPHFYLRNDPEATVVRAARDTNAAMPARVVQRLADAYGKLDGARVVILGASYRGGVKEAAFSGVFPLSEELQARGAVVAVHDPIYSDAELSAMGLTPYRIGAQADAAIVQADHAGYKELRPEDLPGVRVIADGRSFLDARRWPGVQVLAVGRG